MTKKDLTYDNPKLVLRSAVVGKDEQDWTLHSRWSDIRSNGLIEAICPHGVGHHLGIHGCDGCCKTIPKEFRNQVTKD